MACQLRKNTFKRAENVEALSVTPHHHDLSYQIHINLCTLTLFDINSYSSVQTAYRRGSSRPSCVHATGQDCKSFKAEGHSRTQPRRCPRLLRRSPPTPRPVRSAGPHTSLQQVSPAGGTLLRLREAGCAERERLFLSTCPWQRDKTAAGETTLALKLAPLEPFLPVLG